MQVRRQNGLPAGPPHVGMEELLLDGVTGRLYYKKDDGTLARVERPFGRLVGKFFQDGTATAPVGDIIENDFGGTPVWSRTSAGSYTLDLGAALMSEDYAVVFATLQGATAARVIMAWADAGQHVIVETYDAAGVLVEGDCAFALLVLSYTDFV